MDNEKNVNQDPGQDEKWLDEILGEAESVSEIGADEQAVSSVGLTHPEDAELESILAENWDEVPDAPEEEPAEAGTEEAAEPESYPENDGEEKVTVDDPKKKARPGRKKGYGLLGIPHILATVIWLLIIVAVGVGLGRTIWACTADLMAFGKGNNQVTITITDSDNIETVSQKLHDANLIRYPGLFRTFAELTHKDERISVGTFTLNSSLDYNAMINAMGSYAPAREEVEVLIPEGYNCAQIFKLLEDKKVCAASELEAYAADGELDDYWFLKGVKRGSKYSLEGYLAPDTYKFYTNDEPERVLEKMLDEFDSRITDKMRAELELLQERYASNLAAHGKGEDYLKEHPLNLHSIVTLASIIERETSSDTESFDIASVFFNRLCNPDNFPTLDSDATVYYAIGDYFSKKTDLTAQDLASTSPYNTYVAQGLPPAPICNTGVNSLYAALDPNSTDYYFFVYDEDEYKHLFASTLEGHNQNVQKVGG